MGQDTNTFYKRAVKPFVALSVALLALASARPARADVTALVKGGCFLMGDTFSEGNPDEYPIHEVCLSTYYMDKHEVTQKSFLAAMGYNPSHFKGDDLPVEGVTWQEAHDYCRKLGTRLPTEAEWEYAARERGRHVRFGTGTIRVDPAIANYNTAPLFRKDYSEPGEYRKKTTPVESFAPNANHLSDMSGNVWEWVEDFYGADYYAASPKDDPKGPPEGDRRVLRGGSWLNGPHEARAANRRPGVPDKGNRDTGFRCARNP